MMRRAVLATLGVLLSTSALAQSSPAWQSHTLHPDAPNILAEGTNGFNAWFAKKADAVGGTLTGATIDATSTIAGIPASTFITGGAGGLTAAQLGASAITTTGTTFGRALSDRFADRLSVKDYGAKCDGVTDDTAAFNAASAFAITHPKNSNNAWEIDVPAGRCLLTAPWVVAYQNADTSIRLHGDGSAMTELLFRGGIDGIRVTFAQNPTSNYASNTSGNGNEAARSTNWPGQGITVDGFSLLTDTQSKGRLGTALSVTAIPLINASDPPFQVYSDIIMTAANGYDSGANNWLGGLLLTDPDNAFVKQVRYLDHNLTSNTASIPFHIHSTAVLGDPHLGGHGNINISDSGVFGGNTAFLIDGNSIQGVNLSHIYAVGVQTAVSWLAPANSLTGSLTIDHSSLGAQHAVVTLANVSTVFSDHNFYYNVAPTQCQNTTFFSSVGGDTVDSDHDTILGPLAGYVNTGCAAGSTFKATAMAITAPSSYDVQQSMISDDIISHFDIGISTNGGPISYKNVSIAADTAVPYIDTGTSTVSGLHPTMEGINVGQTVIMNDGQGTALGYDWLVQRYMNGGLELGMPGMTSPGGVTGYAGQIDGHSAASTNGLIGGLSDYDARLAWTGGTSGVSGQGGIQMYGLGGFTMNGPLVNSHGLFTLGGDNAAAINMKSMGLGNTYDVQLIDSAGTKGVAGQGILDIHAAIVRINAQVQMTGLTLPNGLLSIGGTYPAAFNMKGTGSVNTYDAQIIESGTIAGTPGQGMLTVNDLFTTFNSPVLTPDIRYIGFVVPATSTATGNTGDSGDGILGGVLYHFYCYNTNQWSRVALSTTAW